MNWRDILERAGWTAVQGAISAVPVAQITATLFDVSITGIQQLWLAAVGGAVAALSSFFKTLAQERLGVLETRASEVLDGHPFT